VAWPRVVKRCLGPALQNLFQYLDEDGQRHTVSSQTVNALPARSLTGAGLSPPRIYRTWAGTGDGAGGARGNWNWQPGIGRQTSCVAILLKGRV